jgi:hypothetical protein
MALETNRTLALTGILASRVSPELLLAFAIADDGCLCRELREELRRLSACLDNVLPAADRQSQDWAASFAPKPFLLGRI